MQAQVEPHFLFNTLASVQYLTETDPKQASVLLGHLIELPARGAAAASRALVDARRARSSLAEAYLNILKMRIGPRLAFAIDLPDALRDHPFPPNLLISLVENAIKHGIEPSADGGVDHARRDACGDDAVVVTRARHRTRPDGRRATDGQGVGLDERPRAARRALRRARPLYAGAGVAARHARDAVAAIRGRVEPTAVNRDADRAHRRRRADAARAAQGAARRSMARACATIVEAENGEQALALIDERRPDVAFLDIRMPRQVGSRRRARARRPLSRRVRDRVRRIRDRRVRRRRGRLRAEAGHAGAHRARSSRVSRLASPRRRSTLRRCCASSPSAKKRPRRSVDPRVARQRHADDRRRRRRLLPGRGQVHEGRDARIARR